MPREKRAMITKVIYTDGKQDGQQIPLTEDRKIDIISKASEKELLPLIKFLHTVHVQTSAGV